MLSKSLIQFSVEGQGCLPSLLFDLRPNYDGGSERGEQKVGLKLNIQKTKIMASGPITSWQIDGETVETVSDFTILGSKITADGDCSHEIKKIPPWKKSYDQPR